MEGKVNKNNGMIELNNLRKIKNIVVGILNKLRKYSFSFC